MRKLQVIIISIIVGLFIVDHSQAMNLRIQHKFVVGPRDNFTAFTRPVDATQETKPNMLKDNSGQLLPINIGIVASIPNNTAQEQNVQSSKIVIPQKGTTSNLTLYSLSNSDMNNASINMNPNIEKQNKSSEAAVSVKKSVVSKGSTSPMSVGTGITPAKQLQINNSEIAPDNSLDFSTVSTDKNPAIMNEIAITSGTKEESSTESIAPTGQRIISLDVTKVPSGYSKNKTSAFGLTYNPVKDLMPDYVTELAKNNKFAVIAKVIPEVLSTYAVDYTYNMKLAHTATEFATYSYSDWLDPSLDSSDPANLYQGLIFLNELFSRPDFKIYSQSPFMTKPVKAYIDALRIAYPLVSDKILAMYVTVYFNNVSSSATPEQLVDFTKNMKMPIKDDNFDSSQLKKDDIKKMYITMMTIQKVNAKYKQYLSESSVDNSALSTPKNQAATTVVAEAKTGSSIEAVGQNVNAVPTVAPTGKGAVVDQAQVAAAQKSIKLSLDATTVPAADAIQAMVQNVPGDITRFAQFIGIPSDAFTKKRTSVFNDNVASAIETTPFSISDSDENISHIAESYNSDNEENSLDPLIAINNDINALTIQYKRAKLGSTEYTNLNTFIKTAGKAAAKISADILAKEAESLFEASLPSDTLSIYSAVKKAEECKTKAEEAVTNLKNQDPTALAIAQQYKTLYTQVHDQLKQIQAKVLALEGERLSARIMKKDSDTAIAALPEEQQKTLTVKQAELQVQLDLKLQQDAENIRKPLEKTLFDTLSPAMDPQDQVTSIKNVLDKLITELDSKLGPNNDFSKDVTTAKDQLIKGDGKLIKSNLRKNPRLKNGEPVYENGQVVYDNGIVDELQTLVSGATKAHPDFKEFLQATDTLQIYINVIDKLLTTMETTAEQKATNKDIAGWASSYAEKSGDTISDIEAKLKTNTFTDADTEKITDNIGGHTVPKTELLTFYKQVLKELKITQANTIHDKYVNPLVASIDTVTQNPESAQHDPIVVALKQLLECTSVNASKNIKNSIETILNTYTLSNSKATADAAKVVATAMKTLAASGGVKTLLNNLIASEITTTDFSQPIPEKPIISTAEEITHEKITQAMEQNQLNPVKLYAAAIEKISDRLTQKAQEKEDIADLFTTLKISLSISDAPGNITKAKIDTALQALKDLNSSTSQETINKKIDIVNNELLSKIPHGTSFVVVKGVLDKLSEASTKLVESTTVYKIGNALSQAGQSVVDLASNVAKPFTSTTLPTTALSPEDQAAVDGATEKLKSVVTKSGVTQAEVETGLHEFVRTLTNTSIFVKVGIGTILSSPFVITIIGVLAQMLIDNQNSNATQEEKDKRMRELLSAGLKDITNGVIAEQLGADVSAVQAGDVQGIAISAALNSLIYGLDPDAKAAYQYDPASRANSMMNINKLKADMDREASASKTKSTPTSSTSKTSPSGKSTTTYPSYQDLLDMENESQSKTTYPSYQDLLDMENENQPSPDEPSDGSLYESSSSTPSAYTSTPVTILPVAAPTPTSIVSPGSVDTTSSGTNLPDTMNLSFEDLLNSVRSNTSSNNTNLAG